MQAIVPRETVSALSRLEREFESRWERHEFKALPILVKPVLGSRVPQNANACDENLTRLPRVVGRLGLRSFVRVVGPHGKPELRYLTDSQLAELCASSQQGNSGRGSWVSSTGSEELDDNRHRAARKGEQEC